jgi:hypothetical protein
MGTRYEDKAIRARGQKLIYPLPRPRATNHADRTHTRKEPSRQDQDTTHPVACTDPRQKLPVLLWPASILLLPHALSLMHAAVAAAAIYGVHVHEPTLLAISGFRLEISLDLSNLKWRHNGLLRRCCVRALLLEMPTLRLLFGSSAMPALPPEFCFLQIERLRLAACHYLLQLRLHPAESY